MAKVDQQLPDNNDGDKYWKSVKARGYENLKQTPAEAAAKTPEDLIKVLLREGAELLAADENKNKTPEPPKPKSDAKALEKAMGEMSKNPYIRARIKVLNDMSEEKRKRIEELEKNGQTDTVTYKEFVKMVTLLGDKFSEKSN